MSEDWPAWATQPVAIAPPDPTWPAQAAVLAAAVEDAVGHLLEGGVVHIGSTAVPDLPAKPVIDLLGRLRERDGGPHADAPLAAAGWALIPPELDQRPWRRAYVLPEGDVRRAHLHLVAADAPEVADLLAFRDALRADRELAGRYAALKRALAAAHRDDREAYTIAKAAFVREVLAR